MCWTRRRNPRCTNLAARSSGVPVHSSRWASGEVRASRWRSDIGEASAVSLGTDGAFDCTPGDTMQAAHFAAQSYGDPLSPGALLEMQTINAAAAAGLDAELGSLEPGKRADVVVRIGRSVPEAYPANNPIHVLALTMGSGSVDTVLVNGEVVFSGGRLNSSGRGRRLPGRLGLSGCASEAARCRSGPRVADRELTSERVSVSTGHVSGLDAGGLLLKGRVDSGPSFVFPEAIAKPSGTDCVDDVALLDHNFSGWQASEVPECAPIVGVVEDGQAVSVCFCARRSDVAAEAGVETAVEFRGRGLAPRVTAAWGLAIRASGRIPLYSTSWSNEASLAVARKLGLVAFASTWSVS